MENQILFKKRALNINYDQMKPYSERLVTRAISENLSVACIDNTTREVIGFCLIEDLNAPPLSSGFYDIFIL